MSRVANSPIVLPANTSAEIDNNTIKITGNKGEFEKTIHPLVDVNVDSGSITLKPKDSSKTANAIAGTYRSVLNNMVVGVSQGFEKKLVINGVGYRGQVQGKVLNLTLGLSHPVNYQIPEGITIETPTQTEIVVKGSDKQIVGQVAAEIRAYRKPEPYKGKGIKYVDENIIRKEAKKA